MSHTAGSRTPHHRSRAAFRPAALACGLLAALLSGCGKPPGSVSETGGLAAEKEDPWKAFVKRLRKENGADACRAALSALSNGLPNAPEAPKPKGLAPEQEEALAKLVPLNKDDRAEVRPADFTAHDAAYLAECLYLRDAARSFDVPDRPGESPEQAAARRADAAYAWVCRQVYLNPWLVPLPDDPNRLQGTALPPSWVLRRGYGSGLERMYVFLGLLQQMGLDGCLVGPKDAETLPAGYVAQSAGTILTGAPRGPFWAVGVRTGPDVRLYDPWRGQPFPAPLGQIRANPDAHRAWFEDKANVSGITPALAKDAAVCLAVPVNSLAPRLATVEEQLKADVGVRLAADAAKLAAAFPGAKFWNPPTDPFAYGRTARQFLPPDLGGSPNAGPARLFGLYVRSQLPPATQLLPPELLNRPEILEDVGERIVRIAESGYGLAFVYPLPTPRERLQRGQFQDAARELVNRQDLFGRGLEQIRRTPDADRQIKAWADAALQLYTEQGRALTNRDADARDRARAAIDAHWTSPVAVALLVPRAVSAVAGAEATLLLALCKHEQAERLQTQLDAGAGDPARLRDEASAAWLVARDAWQSYAPQAAAHAGFPGRSEHAKALAARAEQMAGKK